MRQILITLSLLLITGDAASRNAISSQRFELLSGIRNARDKKSVWDNKYRRKGYLYGKEPAVFLSQNYHYLAPGSRVLDMGMGEGRNAVFLARKGFDVLGIDISSVAIKKARRLAVEQGVKIKAKIASLNNYKIREDSFDAIVCFFYVDRSLVQKMQKWLKPGGVLIFQAHTEKQKAVAKIGKENEKYLLKEGELLSMFKGMKILKYEEPDFKKEFTAALIAQKLP